MLHWDIKSGVFSISEDFKSKTQTTIRSVSVLWYSTGSPNKEHQLFEVLIIPVASVAVDIQALKGTFPSQIVYI